MKCPVCGCPDTKVTDSRSTEDDLKVRRRRECTRCGYRFTTYEVIETVPVVVKKKDKSREPFDRNKLLNGLLRACEKRPVPLATLEELVMSAEYIMAEGNDQVILCERGIRTFETSMRNTLDISAVPMLKKMTHLPVVIDPSHAAGIAWMVEPLAAAAVAAGADGLMVEVHNDPAHALCDGAQSLTPAQFSALMDKLRPLVSLMGKTLD